MSEVWIIENLPYERLMGIDHRRFAEELTPENWWDKATVRRIDGRLAIVSVRQLRQHASTPVRRKFEVMVDGVDGSVPGDREFPGNELQEALAYANNVGEAVPRSEWPPERPAPSVIIFPTRRMIEQRRRGKR